MEPQSGGLLGCEDREELSAELVLPHRSLNIVPTVTDTLLSPDMIKSPITLS